jgi:hypothetical protein
MLMQVLPLWLSYFIVTVDVEIVIYATWTVTDVTATVVYVTVTITDTVVVV